MGSFLRIGIVCEVKTLTFRSVIFDITTGTESDPLTLAGGLMSILDLGLLGIDKLRLESALMPKLAIED